LRRLHFSAVKLKEIRTNSGVKYAVFHQNER